MNHRQRCTRLQLLEESGVLAFLASSMASGARAYTVSVDNEDYVVLARQLDSFLDGLILGRRISAAPVAVLPARGMP